MSEPITWTPCTVRLGDLKPWGHNPRQSTKKQAQKILASFSEFGQVETVAIGPDLDLYNGHQRLGALLTLHGPSYTVDARQSSRALTEDERKRLTVYLHAGAVGSWDWDLLSSWEPGDLVEWGLDDATLADWRRDTAALGEMLEAEKPTPTEDPGAQIDRAEELRELWGVELGQMWQLGDHRLICGDCTDPAVVGRVMGGEKADLCHADPPYGMGKEKDGIANDNLYREKLDAFLMAWWKAARPHIKDNGSAYIWGNAEDLWRLWYVGGLKDSERLTLRNEIAWDKSDDNPTMLVSGVPLKSRRMYHPTERALFFMLGEQGFNNNADNYWEGWEPIRGYLDGERIKIGWSKPDVEKILGSVNKTQHIFSISHFNLITEADYKTLQRQAAGNAFKREYDDIKREYDDIKREFYATRTYFDNAHDSMTDVWSFKRVIGGDRHDHATPKPVTMMERIIKSSAPEDGVVYVPFNGTGPELIACEQLSRKCRAVEISPAYVAVALQRWADMTGESPMLMESA